MPRKKVLCFGELLLRMSPQADGKWLVENSMPVYVGGAELNVATALAKWKIPVKYFTALPDHSLSQDLLKYLSGKSIDTSSVKISGERTGIYFLPQGSDLKNAGVIYDRAHSSFAGLRPEMIDWNNLLADVEWVHLSAINPALNEYAAEVSQELLIKASQKGITVSLDLNFRSKLWRYGKRPAEVVSRLAGYCDHIMGNIWAVEELLDIPVDATILQDRNKQACLDHALHTSKAIRRKFPKVKTISNTFRFDRPANGVHYFATLYHNDQLLVSDEIQASEILDKIGSGDCFMAGLIYGLYIGLNKDEIVNFSASAAVGKMYEKSDATDQTVEQISVRITKNRGKYKNEQTTIINE